MLLLGTSTLIIQGGGTFANHPGGALALNNDDSILKFARGGGTVDSVIIVSRFKPITQISRSTAAMERLLR